MELILIMIVLILIFGGGGFLLAGAETLVAHEGEKEMKGRKYEKAS